MKKWGIKKVLYEIELFVKAECLVKTVKKCFLKNLSVWLALIKVVVLVVNYQKGQYIYIYINEFISYLNQYCEIIFFFTNIS